MKFSLQNILGGNCSNLYIIKILIRKHCFYSLYWLSFLKKEETKKESIYPLSTEEVTQTPVELGKEILMEEGTVLPAIK
jgi:hypothetical protein